MRLKLRLCCLLPFIAVVLNKPKKGGIFGGITKTVF